MRSPRLPRLAKQGEQGSKGKENCEIASGRGRERLGIWDLQGFEKEVERKRETRGV